MLSRVANSLYWLSRYLERAENLARIVNVSSYASLDAGGDEYVWRPALLATCSEEIFEKAQKKESGTLDAGRFITFSDSNPDSIAACIGHARENARMVRDQISEEMWLEINSFHLFIRSQDARELFSRQPEALYREVIKFCLLYEGLIEATILHDEGWQFIQVGKFLERADKTSRILDMLTYHNSIDRNQLVSVLRSCSGFAAFRTEFRGDVTTENVVSFLLFSQTFPRSIRFCLRQLDSVLHKISGMPSGSFANEGERLTGSILAQMNFSNAHSVWEVGLHSYIDDLQEQLNQIGQQVFETYVLLPSEVRNMVRADSLQMQWQQQQ
jgi:uncharacterized alpha-E superfamily protein